MSITLRSSANTVQVVVADTGIGISREELSKVFEKFYQADPDNAGQVRGFGLGLFYAASSRASMAVPSTLTASRGRGVR